MRAFKARPVGISLAVVNLALFAVLLTSRPPDYEALRVQDELAGFGQIVDFEEIYLAGRRFPGGPMHASPGDWGGLYMVLNTFGTIGAGVPAMLLEPLHPWGKAGTSWILALLFSITSTLQWVALGSPFDAVWRWTQRPAA